ncbi:peptidoglycan DD-metalloendopeptidase family protein [Fundidesulfovibrio agrisoli]|uniref:peptidoglycan DD-metalloendopeptidase family protein n=1 Tax=Fundidesulfovibrio agrisoli TaxID=2922717 RepID=UPI001FADD8DB|nr:peptidoglycan DD-metalloendopeptidase family protein [Fundidesulfovibrio agrisoli]
MAVAPETSLKPEQLLDVQKKTAMDALRKRVTPGPAKDAKLNEACEGFEAVFIGQMLKEMRNSIPKDGLLHGKHEDQYVAMFDEELSKTLAKQGGMGLADFMRQQLAAKGQTADPKDGAQNRPGLHVSGTERLSAPSAEKKAGKRMGQHAATPLSNKIGMGRPDQASGGEEQAQAPAAPAPRADKSFARETRETVDPMQAAAQATAEAEARARAQAAQAPGTLDGTPSQHLGLPGAQYLQGADKALALAPGFTTPVQGELTSGFGWRRDPFTGQRAWHSGVDIAAPEGSPVRACADGVVSFAGGRGGYGNMVELRHADGTVSIYGHNKANGVVEGQSVKAGQVIAQVGQTGRATGPHVHFEIRRDGVAVNPGSPGGATLAQAEPQRVPIPDL